MTTVRTPDKNRRASATQCAVLATPEEITAGPFLGCEGEEQLR